MSFTYMLMSLLMLTTGTVFLMWLGEQIDEYGIGNGISLIIMAGIVAQMPQAVIYVAQHARWKGTAGPTDMDVPKILFLVIMFVTVVAGAILITQGQRRIPIQQAKQTRGRRVYGGQRHYLPLRVNHGGVMPFSNARLASTSPTIFAAAMLPPYLIFSRSSLLRVLASHTVTPRSSSIIWAYTCRALRNTVSRGRSLLPRMRFRRPRLRRRRRATRTGCPSMTQAPRAIRRSPGPCPACA